MFRTYLVNNNQKLTCIRHLIGFLNKEEIDFIKEESLKLESEEASIYNNDDDKTLNKLIRSTEMKILNQNDGKFYWLFEKLGQKIYHENKDNWDFSINGISENFQYLTYSKSSHFTWHLDIGGTSFDRKLSTIIFLNDKTEYEGGEIEFFRSVSPEAIYANTGDLLIFPSFLLHRVLPIKSGRRSTLVNWASGPSFV